MFVGDTSFEELKNAFLLLPIFDMGEIHFRSDYHADKIKKPNALLAVIREETIPSQIDSR